MSNSEVGVPIASDNITQRQVDEGLRCTVCHEDFRLGEPVSKLVCNHVFHSSCINPWLEQRDTCPVCRRVLREITPENSDSENELFADDEDDAEEEIVVVDDAISDGIITVSVEYRSMGNQPFRSVFETTDFNSGLSHDSITVSDSESSSNNISNDLGSLVSDSFSSSTNSNSEDHLECFELPSIDSDSLDDCSDPHVCFLEVDSSESDSSDSMDMDFSNTLESSDLNLSSASPHFDITFETNMDIDLDMM